MKQKVSDFTRWTALWMQRRSYFVISSRFSYWNKGTLKLLTSSIEHNRSIIERRETERECVCAWLEISLPDFTYTFPPNSLAMVQQFFLKSKKNILSGRRRCRERRSWREIFGSISDDGSGDRGSEWILKQSASSQWYTLCRPALGSSISRSRALRKERDRPTGRCEKERQSAQPGTWHPHCCYCRAAGH